MALTVGESGWIEGKPREFPWNLSTRAMLQPVPAMGRYPDTPPQEIA